jgi:predicted permease
MVRSPLQDVRYGLRLVRRSPGFSAVVILTLALGIGANTAIFSILNALLLRSLPVSKPDQLMQLNAIYRNGGTIPLSSPMYQQVAENQRVFSELFAWSGDQFLNVQIDSRLLLPAIRGVSGNYYAALGVSPLLGKLIGAEDAAHTPGANVAVLGYEFWDREFGRDAGVIGKQISIDGRAFTIIGVSRRWFTGMTPGAAPDITIPYTSGPFTQYSENPALQWLFIGGRLREGVTTEQALAQLKTFWTQALANAAPTAVPGPRLQSWMAMRLEVNSAATGVNRTLREHFARPLQVLTGGAALILLVACVNLASLALARAAVRSGEISVRISLGATRMEIARQLLTETLLLCAAGALVALALARWTSRLLVALIGGNAASPVLLDLRPDWRVFTFTAAAAITTGILIAMAPAWQMFRQKTSGLLGAQRVVARGSGRMGKALIVTQIALSFVLVLGAGLMLRTFENLRSLDPQFEKSSVLQVVLQTRPDVPAGDDSYNYRKELQERISALPGVISASYGGLEIPTGFPWRDTVSEPGSDSQNLAVLIRVSPGFFRALGMPMIAGRDFDVNDDEKHPQVAIVDSNLAAKIDPSGRVLGKVVRFGVQPDLQRMEIVGVVRSARLVDFRDPRTQVIYIPTRQQPKFLGSPSLGNMFVRAKNPEVIAKPLEREIQALGREYASSTRTLEETSDRALAEDRATAMLSSWFAGLALLLAGIGLFGLMSYSVTQRTREIGVRMALGSQRAGILRLILSQSMILAVTGVMIGIPCALFATRLITHVLFGVSAADPLTYGMAALVLLAVGILAGFLPAQRASRTDPMIALRCE